MIQLAIAFFLIGWFFTEWLISVTVLFKWTRLNSWICQKCITFWLTLGLAMFYLNVDEAIVMAAASAFLAHTYQIMLEKYE